MWEWLMIDGLWITPSLRGQGLGRRLLLAAEKIAIKRGCRGSWLGTSYPFHIVEHEDGHLENTLGGKVSPGDAIKIEHTAKCLSSHQGEHRMSFCDAELFDGGLLLEVTGGLPAYASSLSLQIDKDKKLKCRFEAHYPMSVPGEKLAWRITKKAFKMTNDDFKAGVRLLGWLSVEFEETCTIDGKVARKSHKIEGYVKPVIKKPASDPKPRQQ